MVNSSSSPKVGSPDPSLTHFLTRQREEGQ